MIPVWGHDRAVSAWVAERTPGCERGFETSRALGVVSPERQELVAGMVYHNWVPEHGVIEISGASTTPRWLTPAVLWEMFDYPFNRAGCQMVLMRVAERNRQWNGRGLPRLLKAYGFDEKRIKRLFGRHEDGLVYTLTDDAWRANGFHQGRHHVQAQASDPA